MVALHVTLVIRMFDSEASRLYVGIQAAELVCTVHNCFHAVTVGTIFLHRGADCVINKLEMIVCLATRGSSSSKYITT